MLGIPPPACFPPDSINHELGKFKKMSDQGMVNRNSRDREWRHRYTL